MSVQCEVSTKGASPAPMGIFERFLTVWVFLCIVTGIMAGEDGPFGVKFNDCSCRRRSTSASRGG